MNILLTGGCGFIGSNILKALYHSKNVKSVIVLDNLSSGRFQNIKEYVDGSRIVFHEGDIRNYTTCLQVLKNIDIVCHQAALGSVPRSIDNPLLTNDNNVTGFLNLLFAAKESKIKKFVFAASSSTYGDSSSLPKIEDKIGKPLSPYAVSKYINELYTDVFSRCYNLNYIGLRYFNVFGPNQNPFSNYAAVIPTFCKNIIDDIDISINGDGSVSRDFTYVDNVVHANLLAMFTNNYQAINQIFNVACGEMFSLKYLAEQLVFLSGKDVNINYVSPRMGDIDYSLASIDKIKKYLNYEVQVNFNKGLEFTWNYFLNQFNRK